MAVIKFIADVNIEKPIVDFISKQGYDIKWLPDYDCAMLDQDLLQLANKERRILITNDKDFGELIFLQKRLSVGIVLIRVKGQGTQEKLGLVKKILKHHCNKLLNHFTVITKAKIRIMPMEDIK